MIKYNSDQNCVVQDYGLLEAPIKKLGCRRRSVSKFVSTLIQEKLNQFDLSFGFKFSKA
jgi:hypothetical protein